MSPASAELSDVELEQFDAFTSSPAMAEHAMDACTLQGLAAALAIGPRVISPAIWLSWVWDRHSGRRPPAFASLDEANAMLSLVMRHYNAVVSGLQPSESCRLRPLFRCSPRWGAAEFCQGFLIGINLAFEDWAPRVATQPELMAAFQTLGRQSPEALMALDDVSLDAAVRNISMPGKCG